MERVIQFLLPEHAAQARALGYACGLSTGIATPGYLLDQLPEKAPVQATGQFTTNDAKLFGELFREGHDAGLHFGRSVARELAQVLASLPKEHWWSICISFAFERMQVKDESSENLSAEAKLGVEGFRSIYQRHLL